MDLSLADQIFSRIEALAQLSEESHQLTRRSFTTEHRRANDLVREWMQQIGMTVHTDAVGNIIGRLNSGADHIGSEVNPNATPALLIGSHLDTVRNGGKFDGMLGVVLPLVCLQHLQEHNKTLPYPVEVIGFCDEEGVRFPSTLLGSRALAGTLNPAVLNECDDEGFSVAQALVEFGASGTLESCARSANDYLGFIECHIEQGPVLEQEDLPIGLVTGISGASRFRITVTGKAGHAGTVPMGMRKDALVAACECIVEIETLCSSINNLVGTVGQITALPGAGNVIPGDVEFSLDLRIADDKRLADATSQIEQALQKIAKRRQISIDIEQNYHASSVACDPDLSNQLGESIKRTGYRIHSLPSGAGHDAMAIASITRIAMLFVRCKEGVSHHPDESISRNDAAAAAQVLINFLQHFDKDR